MEARGRTLIAHGADYEEWGIGGLMSLDPGADSRGISLSLGPAWGEPQSGVQRLQENGITRMAADGAGETTVPPARLEATLGYGFGVLADQGVLTPYSGVSLSGDDSRRFSLGGRLEIGSSLNLSLEGERRDPANDAAAEHGVMPDRAAHAGPLVGPRRKPVARRGAFRRNVLALQPIAGLVPCRPPAQAFACASLPRATWCCSLRLRELRLRAARRSEPFRHMRGGRALCELPCARPARYSPLSDPGGTTRGAAVRRIVERVLPV